MKSKSFSKDWFDKLTEAERSIWILLFYHPDIVTNRTSALNMLFCLFGGGIGWSDGKIVDSLENNYLTATKQRVFNIEDTIYKKAFENTWGTRILPNNNLKREDVDIWESYYFYYNAKCQYVLKNIKELTMTSIPIKYFYPLSQYSNLMCIPDNVKPDWLALAIETYNLIMCCDPLFHHADMGYVNKTNIGLAKKIRPQLLTLIKKNKLSGEKISTFINL